MKFKKSVHFDGSSYWGRVEGYLDDVLVSKYGFEITSDGIARKGYVGEYTDNSLLVDLCQRGRGFGYLTSKETLSLILETASEKGIRIQYIIGKTDIDNPASMKIFEKLNFKLYDTNLIDNEVTYRLELDF